MFKTVKWHDGNNLSMADFVMTMIMAFDRSKPESAIYDEQSVPAFDVFMENFKGMKIVSTDPLVLEYYSDAYQTDAEVNMPANIFYPSYAFGEGAWEMLAIGNMAEADGKLAYSADKATAKEIEQTSFVGGPSMEVLAGYLDKAIADKTIPYAATLGQYLTADEAVTRYQGVKDFYAAHKHMWIGTGPYYLDQAFMTEKSLVLKQFADYPDLADRFAGYGEPKLADVEIDGPGQVKIGEEATFNVYVTYKEEPYAAADIKQVKYLLYDAAGEIVAVKDATMVEDGTYEIVLDAATTGALAAGSNKLEVAVVPLVVSVPTFTSMEFVTAP